MKEIDIQKVRTAILLLQHSGAKESAQAVWDLLDHYVSQPAQRLVMRQDGPQVNRGASAAGLPGCTVGAFGVAAGCTRPAWGSLAMVDGSSSYSMCCEHGELFNRPGYADWVQTFFGGEGGMKERSENFVRGKDCV